MTLNAEKLSQGMTTQQYMEYIKVNKQPFLDIYAAVAIPAYARFFGHGEVEANLSELSNVQAAMDAMLAQNGLGTIQALTTGTNNFSKLPTGEEGDFMPEALYPDFLRFGNAENPTKCLYTWNNIGKLAQTCP